MTNGKLFAVSPTGERHLVKVYHWWPGREWAGPSPIPAYLLKQMEAKRRRYLTYVRIDGIESAELASAFPFPIQYEIAEGVDIAVGRLRHRLEKAGWRLEG